MQSRYPGSFRVLLFLAAIYAIALVFPSSALPEDPDGGKPAPGSETAEARGPAPPAAPLRRAPIIEEESVASVLAPEQSVALAQFTTRVEDREPVDSIAFLENEARNIVFYSDLRGFEGETIVHRWEYGDEVMAEVSFTVGGKRWRVWSSKELLPAWIGDWTVSVVKFDGEIVATESFSYNEKL